MDKERLSEIIDDIVDYIGKFDSCIYDWPDENLTDEELRELGYGSLIYQREV